MPGSLVGIATGLRLDKRRIGYRLLAGLKKSILPRASIPFVGLTHSEGNWKRFYRGPGDLGLKRFTYLRLSQRRRTHGVSTPLPTRL